MLIEYIKVFAVGGVLCAIGQILIDKTKLTPARILTVYVVAGLILEAVGLYSPLVKWAGAGATVPLTGFGSTLAKGVEKAVSEVGVLGAFTGGCRHRRSRVLRNHHRASVQAESKKLKNQNARNS